MSASSLSRALVKWLTLVALLPASLGSSGCASDAEENAVVETVQESPLLGVWRTFERIHGQHGYIVLSAPPAGSRDGTLFFLVETENGSAAVLRAGRYRVALSTRAGRRLRLGEFDERGNRVAQHDLEMYHATNPDVARHQVRERGSEWIYYNRVTDPRERSRIMAATTDHSRL